MNKADLVGLACKVLGLVLCVMALNSAVRAVSDVGMVVSVWDQAAASPQPPTSGRGADFALGIVLMSAPPILYVLAALLVWRKSDRIATFLLRHEAGSSVTLPFDPRALMIVSFTVVGLFVLLSGLASGARLAVLLVDDARRAAWLSNPAIAFRTADCAAAIVKIGAGLWLLLGARGVVTGIQRLRGFRLAPPREPIDRPA